MEITDLINVITDNLFWLLDYKNLAISGDVIVNIPDTVFNVRKMTVQIMIVR